MVVIGPMTNTASYPLDEEGSMDVPAELIPSLNKSLSVLSFDDDLGALNRGYIFNAGTDLLAPSKLQSYSGMSRDTGSKNGTEESRDNSAGYPSFEAPDPTIAAAFLAKASTSGVSDGSALDAFAGAHLPWPTVIAASGQEVLLPDSEALEHFSQDLIPYFLCQYELEGVAVTAHPIPADLPQEARKAAKSTPIGAIPEFESLAISVMQQARPSLAGLDAKDVKLEMRSMAEVLKLACEARMTDGRSEVPLAELMYDDAFVHGLVNFQQQPSKQLLDMMKWLFEEVNDLHAKGYAHGSISLACIMCHPAEGWRLLKSEKQMSLTDAQQDDINQVARIMCFMCLSSEHRRSYQPHHLGGLKNKELLELIANVPDVRMVADAMFSGRATLAKGLDFHLWHPLAVHAQVMLDTKAVMRSMRLGSEDFDTNYNTIVLRGQSWKDVLGSKLIPDVIVASRKHVLRSDFAPYDFHSAASLLRFTANTIGHFEELQLGLQLSKAAFLDAILALFPALVPVCYHYLAAYPSLHVRNRDSELVFGAIEGDVDATHRIMHNALSGYSSARLWRLSSLEGYEPPSDKQLEPELAKEFEAWRCTDSSCDGSACTLWHDERELRFAKEHLCTEFMQGACRRSACPNAHGFVEIRDAMNDASPICWRWLEGRCHVPHCKYAHTFRRHHASQRSSMDSVMSKSRASAEHRRRSFNSMADNSRREGRRRSSLCNAFTGAGDPNQLDGPADHLHAALDSALTQQAKAPIRPVHARKSMDQARKSMDNASHRSFQKANSHNTDRSLTENVPARPWIAMARASAGRNGKSDALSGGETFTRSAHGGSSSGDENVNGKVAGSGAKPWCNALCNGVMPNSAHAQGPDGKGRWAAGKTARRLATVHQGQ